MTSVRQALVWSFAERYASLVIGLVSSMIVARLLTPTDIGLYSMCAAAIAIATMIREFGVNEYLVQEKQLDRLKLQNAFAVAFVTAWPLGAALFLCRGLLAEAYAEPRVAELLAILSLNFLLLPLSSPAFALLNREVALRKIFFLQITNTAVQAVLSVTLAAHGFGAASLAWTAVAGVVVQTVMVSAMRPRDSFVWPSFRQSGRVFRYGAYQVSARLLDTLTSNAHEFIIAKQFGFAEVGLFSRAKGLIDMFQSNLTVAIARVATPSMARTHRAGESLTQPYARGTAIFTCVTWSFYGFLAIAAPEIIRLMLGPQWDAAAPLATLFAVAMLPMSLCAFAGGLMVAMGQVERRLKVSLAFNPVHLLGLLVVAPLGVRWLPLVWLVTALAMLGVYTLHLRRLLGVSVRDLYGQSLASMPVALGTVVVQLPLMQFARGQGWPAVVALIVVAGAGVAAWLAAVHLVRHPVREELERVLDRFRKPDAAG